MPSKGSLAVAFFSQKTGLFRYFATQLGETTWHGKDVLDFGGNIGNILRDPESTIDEERYWCIDVDREALDRGKSLHPRAHWLFYNRYCFFFNPRGRPRLALPELTQRFDYILAYSVFTNTARADMVDLVKQLRALLNVGGKLAFTFIDPHHRSWPDSYPGSNLQWRLERDNKDRPEVDTSALMARACDARWCILVNGQDLYSETEAIRDYPCEQQQSCHAFYTVPYIESLFPAAAILPPANDEMQHCCIIDA
jgi:SAM-dependent methyltransferase